MSNINADLYDALRAVNVPEEAARRAALSVVAQPAVIGDMRAEIGDVRAELGDVKADLRALRVEGRITAALVLAIAVRLFFFPGAGA